MMLITKTLSAHRSRQRFLYEEFSIDVIDAIDIIETIESIATIAYIRNILKQE